MFELETSTNKPNLIFISHSHEDRKVAGELKKDLEEYYGISAFVAHDDIEVSAIWRNEIENALRNCTAVVVLLSEAFTHSTWGNQEMGFASALSKTIIPFKLEESVNPYGFFDKWQAKPLDKEKITISTRSVVDVLVKNGSFSKDDFVKLFTQSFNWRKAAARSHILLTLDPSKDQVAEIAYAASENNQIYDSYGAQPYLREFFTKWKTQLNAEVIEKLTEKHLLIEDSSNSNWSGISSSQRELARS